MGELFTDYYNQHNGYHSGASIENGKTVRYVKLVFDDSDFERFADIFVGKLMSAIKTYENKPAVTEEPNERIVRHILADLTGKRPDESMDTLTKALLFDGCKKAADEDASIADIVSDIPKEKSEKKPKPEATRKDWRSCLDAYDMDKITIGVLIKNWKTFTDHTDEYVADFIKTHTGYSVTSVAVNAWANDRTIPRKRYHTSLKDLMKLSDKEFDFALENSTILKAKKRALI